MNILDGLIFGLIQGLTEFLPVSSSGHTLLAGRVLGYTPDVALELIAHIGTLLALIVVMRQPLFEIVKRPFTKKNGFLLVTTAVTGIIFLTNETFFRTAGGTYLSVGFLITATMLVSAHLLPDRNKNMTLIDAVLIGAAQGIAGLPGISRSGATVSAARMAGIGKNESAQYSFLAAIPIIIAASAYEMIVGGFNSLPVWPAVVCFAASFISGLAALKICLRVFSSDNSVYFAVYLVLLSVFLTVNDLFLHII